ncbi:hypothetical protein N7533_009858 [Penicillium manginii]|uniref:uncharacterized protein n=1 Tax=Penicillium manginii TaxID=203109 RepID=UPI0025483E37|nr:uncharacterized protein N7533_009858 [Penicillium manginii]KAJ5744988.1 hypothetical protein N7533_009858 [Penicillium manginii]
MSQSQSELVNDARLPTKLEPERTTHTFLETSHIAGLAGRRARRREREEVWQRQRALEIDTFSTLWLEKCVSDSKGNLRAVREVRRVAPNSLLIDYTRELEAITKLSQQKYDGCFVKSSGWFENDESLFITMEYLPAGDLQRYVVQPFSEPEAQSIALQLLEGLDFMHNNGFSHGDLKPKNIFVLSAGPDWWVKIGDFGISKQVMEGLTGLQSFNGTPAFTAPEVYQQTWQSCETNQEIINTAFAPEIDLWSLGVISYYLLTGKLPFVHQKDLLAYQKNEIELPLGPIGQLLASSEALLFMRAMLAANPSSRLPARDALDHPWLIPLQQDSEPEYEAESRESTHTTHAEEINLSTAQVQTPEMLTQKPRDVLLPGTIGLTTSQQNRPVEDNPPATPITLLPEKHAFQYESYGTAVEKISSCFKGYGAQAKSSFSGFGLYKRFCTSDVSDFGKCDFGKEEQISYCGNSWSSPVCGGFADVSYAVEEGVG